MLRGLVGLIVFVVVTPILATIATLWHLVRRDTDMIVHVGRIWSRILLATIGARPRYHGVDRVPTTTPCVYLSNHASMVDIWVLLLVLPAPVRFVAKSELFRIPFLGWALAASGFVPIDRRDRAKAIESLRRAAATIRAGRPVVLFPEGTRSRDGRLQPFKKGAFHLALEAGVPIVPVAVRDSFERIRPGSIAVRPGVVDVVFGVPIDPRPYRPRDIEGLMRRVHRTIEEQLEAPLPGEERRQAAG